MTTPTKEQCAKLARECGFGDGLLTWPTVDEKFHAFALKVLADADVHRTDLIYKAWHKVGADVAGLKWSDFVDAIRRELVEANELYLAAMNGLMQLQAELEAERKKVKRLVYGIRGIARDTESKAELGLRVDALLTELGEQQ